MLGAITANLSQGASPEANRDALQAALDTHRPVHISRGLYPLAPGAQAKGPGQTVFGDGPHQTLLDCRGDGNFLSDGEMWGFRVQDLQLLGKLGGQQVTGGYAIVMDGSVGSNSAAWQMINCRVRNVLIDGMHHGLYIKDQNNFIADDLQMAAMQGDGIVCESLNSNWRTDCVTLRDIQFQPTIEAVQAGRGTALIIDGNIQTVNIDNFNAVASYRGLDVRNTAALPFGSHAAFIYASNLYVDFPQLEAVKISHVDQARFTDCYFHGSRAGSGLVFDAGARQIKLSNCNSTGHWSNGMHFNGSNLTIHGCDLTNNSQGMQSWAAGLVVTSPARVGLHGGTARGPRHIADIYRANAGAVINIFGTEGTKNF